MRVMKGRSGSEVNDGGCWKVPKNIKKLNGRGAANRESEKARKRKRRGDRSVMAKNVAHGTEEIF